MKDTSRVQGVLFEPCLQRKKRREGPVTCLSSDFSVKEHDSNADYMLLGRNDKFEGNICYKPKRYFNIKKKENDDNQIHSEEDSCDPHVSDEYILLGSNIRFSVNTIYHPRVCWHYYLNSDNVKHLIENDHTNGTVPADSCGGVPPDEEEYILLGNHAKFSDNIIYKQKKRMNNMPSKSAETEHDLNENDDIEKHTEEDSCDPHMQVENIEKNHTNRTVPVHSYGGAVPDQEEYILLGNHAKFSENVVYKQRKRMNNMLSKSAEIERDFDKNEDQYPATKDLKPAPVVDTSKFAKSSKAIMLDNLKSNEKVEQIVNSVKSPVKKSVISENSSPKKHSDNQEKLLGLLYRSGLGPPRSSAIRSSEYQKNFTAKKPLKTDSLVQKPKNLFHLGNHFTQAPSQNDYVVKMSEYQRNFCSPQSEKNVCSTASTVENEYSSVKKIKHPRRSKSVSSKRTERIGALAKSESTEDVCPSKKTSSQPVKNKEKDIKKKTSSRPVKTTESLSTKLETSGPTSSRRTEDSDKTEPKHKMKRAKSLESVTSHPELKNDKSPPVVLMSEYQKNFNSPSSFSYVKNAWINKEPEVPTEDISYEDWYKQVLELREKAAQYRQRALDSHFCSKHMVQLISKETEKWENCRKLSNTTIDPSQMKPAGITYYPPEMFSFKNKNKFRGLSPSANKECKIVLEEVEEALVPGNKHSKLVKDDDDNHQDIKDQEYDNDSGKTETLTISIEEEQNLDGNENENPVTDKEETADIRVVESITEMMNKNGSSCPNGTKRRIMKTNHLQLPKGNNSELSIEYQPSSTTPVSDNKLSDQIQQIDEDLITESKYFKTKSDPSKTENKTENDKCHIDADDEFYHLDLASKVSENYRKPKQVFKSCDSMFAKTPLFGKSSKNKPAMMQQHQKALPNSAPSKKSYQSFLSTYAPTASTKVDKSNKSSSSKRTKPLKSQENLPFKNVARSNLTNGLHPHYEHFSDTYNVRPHPKFDSIYRKSALDKDAISESLDTSGSLISDVLERTRKRMNFW
ncbi:uncharacterized protein LOC115217168 isoform X2 [Octopus sinensis]|uniref:Nuclear protein MDM1 n=1 Tax=Octopus sinensis TaxID=2607531 RepID=A0A7E6F7Q4_9MOLL|nr:uncharacterized protein LOC115217168 isoform X2 [Octopus sinensis]